MNDKTRQFLILFTLLVFLSMITIFHVRMTNPYPDTDEFNGTERNLSSIEFEKQDGDGLLTQSINGLIDLYRDLRTGMEFLDPQASD